MKRDAYYDYIRALAALLVLFCHKGQMPGGSIGVNIFFCLSGFLITRILIGLPVLSLGNLVTFIFRRWMRILPLYLTALLATYFLMRQFRPELLNTFLQFIPGFLTFTSFPSDVGISTAVFWTLHAEFWFYVCFPFLFAFCYPRNLMMPFALALIVASIAAKMLIGHVEATKFSPLLTLIYLDQLMYGTICALLICAGAPVIEAFRSRWWFWGGFAISLAIGKFTYLPSFDLFWYLERSGASLLCAISILHHAANPSESRDNFVARIGRISFSIYLVHGIVFDYLRVPQPPDSLDTPLYLLIVLTVSCFTERFIERPGIWLSKTVTKFRRPLQEVAA